MKIPLAKGDYFRRLAKEARIYLRNRFYEENPSLSPQGTALIARPGLARWLEVGSGPIRGIFSQPGTFDDALFVVSGADWYRIDTDSVDTLIYNNVQGDPFQVVMAGTGEIGSTPPYMFMADGSYLYVYIEGANGYAQATIDGSPEDGDTVTIGTTYYQFTAGNVDIGTPDGTLANPWLVALGTSDAEAWEDFYVALGDTGIAGEQYSTDLLPNDFVTATDRTNGSVSVRAIVSGADGNTITTETTGANLFWSDTTLAGGGMSSVSKVAMPFNVGVISIGYIKSHIVVVPAQDEGVNGRFYWIEPGEIIVDPLNFATAERAPDPISSVTVFGDQFWLPGTITTEAWYFTGDPDAPVLRQEGIVFDRGAWQGTGIQVKDSMIMVGADGSVFDITGGQERISRPDIEERIRKAIKEQVI